MTYDHGNALQLIETSEHEDRITHAEYSAEFAADLLADCDGTVDTGEIVEYWGRSSDDAPMSEITWSVHLHR